jgi:hypothetical protein
VADHGVTHDSGSNPSNVFHVCLPFNTSILTDFFQSGFISSKEFCFGIALGFATPFHHDIALFSTALNTG